MNYRKLKETPILLTVGILLAGALSGCADTAKGVPNPTVSSEADAATQLDTDTMFSNRDKEVGYDENSAITIMLSDQMVSCSDLSVKSAFDPDHGTNTITLTQDGTYLISGSLSDGQIIIDADSNAKLQLVFNQVTINSSSSAPIYVKTADKVFITLAPGTVNTLSTASDYVAIDDSSIDAVIFSKSDLTLNGSGSLTVSSATGHGIVSKDDLVITGGYYDITAAKHALSGKDSVRIADGTLNLSAGKDGIHSENTNDLEKGFIYIAGGDIHITCGSDGLDGDNTVQIEGGSLEIAAGDDGIHSDTDLIISNGTIFVTKSYEGLEGMTITILGGELHIVSSDDGLNAAGSGKSLEPQTSDKSENKREKIDPFKDRNDPGNFGDVDGFDGDQQNNFGGSRQDGFDRGGFGGHGFGDGGQDGFDRGGFGGNGFGDGGQDGFDRGGFGGNGGGFGGGFDEGTDYNIITISGGILYVDAGGDGIDSNGDLSVTGGEIYVYGPTNNGDSALDYAGTGTITGGTIVAVGTSGMAMNFGKDSTQGSMLITVSNSLVSGKVTLTDENDTVIVSCSPGKGYNSVMISAPALASGQTYTLTTGDITTTVNMDNLIYSNSSDTGMRGPFSRFDGSR